jgi:hypothetical protein
MALVMVSLSRGFPADTLKSVAKIMAATAAPNCLSGITTPIVSFKDKKTGASQAWYGCKIKDDFKLDFKARDKIPTPPKSLKELISKPWELQPPFFNDSISPFWKLASSKPITAQLLDARSTETGLFATAKLLNDFEDGTLSDKYFKEGDFKTDGYIYVLHEDDTFTPYIVLQSSAILDLRCCAALVQRPVRDFCPADMSDSDGTPCITLGNTLCGEDSVNNLNPLCGCYPTFVQKEVLDKHPAFKEYLAKKGIQFPPGCSESCTQDKAYGANQYQCNLTICEIDFKNVGKIGNTKLTQNCNGPSPPPSPPTPPPPTPSNFWEKYGLLIIIGGSILAFLFFIIILGILV